VPISNDTDKIPFEPMKPHKLSPHKANGGVVDPSHNVEPMFRGDKRYKMTFTKGHVERSYK